MKMKTLKKEAAKSMPYAGIPLKGLKKYFKRLLGRALTGLEEFKKRRLFRIKLKEKRAGIEKAL